MNNDASKKGKGDDTMMNHMQKLFLIGSILSIGGLILIFFSDNFGMSLADHWLSKYNYADSNTYEFKVKANTNNFLVTGGILFGIGLTMVILTYYKWLQTDK